MKELLEDTNVKAEEKEAVKGIILISIFEILAMVFFYAIN